MTGAIAACPIPPAAWRGLLALDRRRDHQRQDRQGRLREDVPHRRGRPTPSSRREGLSQVADEGALGPVVDEVLAAHPRSSRTSAAGKKEAAGFLVGQVMKATQGKANPQVVNRLLGERLGAG